LSIATRRQLQLHQPIIARLDKDEDFGRALLPSP
jgi:hypothetical protein